MKIIYVNCGIRNEYEGDLRSNKHFVSSSVKIRPVKNSGLYGI